VVGVTFELIWDVFFIVYWLKYPALLGIQDKGSIVDLQNCMQLYLASAFLVLFCSKRACRC
jgi:hypothetical protein